MKKEYTKPVIEIEVVEEQDIIIMSVFDPDSILYDPNKDSWFN